MNKILLALACLLFVFNSLAQTPPKRELRGAWIATFSNIDWPTRTQTPAQQQSTLITILNHHQQTGLNAIYLQVRSQCDALYPSTIEPWTIDLNGQQGRAPSPLWDPMQFAIDESHKRGMEFHAWINPYRAVSNINNLSSFLPTHVAKAHPEWMLTVVTSTGTVQILNPALAAVRNYITSVVVDILSRYDVDGIHFDDYFYPQGTFNDDSYYNADPRGFPATTAGRGDWRRDNVNLLIKKVYDTIRALKPWVKFGVAPTGIYRNSTNPAIGTPTTGLEHYTTLYADSKKWIQQGWVDYLAPEVYWYIGQQGADYSKIVPWWNDNANGRHIYIGMAGYKVGDVGWTSPSMFPSEVRMNRSYSNVSGQIVYNTNSLRSTTRLGFRDSLRLFFYQKPALQPLMLWRDNTPPGAPSALSVLKYGNDSVVLNWTKPAFTSNEMDKAKRFVIYRSTNPNTNINDANNILAITAFDTSAFKDVTITPNTVYYYTVTALDRFHNESTPTNIAANVPPTITCPSNQELELNASCTVSLPDYRSMAIVNNGAASTSPIMVTQSPAAGAIISGTGNTTVTLTATDRAGNSSGCSFVVTRNDVTAPVIANASANPAVLFPPNHKMKNVTVNYSATDNCGAVITSLSVSSNEPQTGIGDGDVGPDWEVIDDHHVKLRAERAGYGIGRIYTITITAADASGNTSTQQVTVTVPHDNSPITRTIPSVTLEEKQNGLLVTALPNPTRSQFVLSIHSSSQDMISIRVTDILGRIVEQRTNISSNGTLTFGAKYKAGVYFVTITQDSEQRIIKLVKQ
jgi:uncharacterized lipoprotein YddW (UPF0748 family)